MIDYVHAYTSKFIIISVSSTLDTSQKGARGEVKPISEGRP